MHRVSMKMVLSHINDPPLSPSQSCPKDTTFLAVGKMWVAGKDDWGVGAQEGALMGECSSGGTGSSHPGIKVPDLPPGVRPISNSPEELREPGGGAPPGGSTDQVVLGVATLK